jgi:hypothetical protein
MDRRARYPLAGRKLRLLPKMLLFSIFILTPTIWGVSAAVGLDATVGTFLVLGVAIVPPLVALVLSPRTRIRPKGVVTRDMRSNAAAGAFILATFTFLLALTLRSSLSASKGAWIGIFYLGVALVAVGVWILRTELTK